MIIRTKLIIDIEAEFEGNQESEETVRFLVDQDLEDAGWSVHSVKLYNQ